MRGPVSGAVVLAGCAASPPPYSLRMSTPGTGSLRRSPGTGVGDGTAVKGENEAKGLTLDLVEANDARLASEHGMPINGARRPHLLVAKPGDLAVKAVQLNQPEFAARFLRALRVAWQTDHRPIDEDAVILEVAQEVGIDRDKLDVWRR